MFTEFRRHGGLLADKVDNYGDQIQEAINTHNKEGCLEIMRVFGVLPFLDKTEQARLNEQGQF